VNQDKISSISSNDYLPENTANKSDISKNNLKQINKIPRITQTKIKNDILELTNKSNSNLESKIITPLIPEKNTLPNTELNKSNTKKHIDSSSNANENKEIKINLTDKFEEVADTNRSQRMGTEYEKLEMSDIKDMCYIPKESKPIIGHISDIKMGCDPIMFQSHSSKEKVSLREGVDFTFKKSIVTDNKTELLLSSNKLNKYSPQHEIPEYPIHKDSFKLSVGEDDYKKKSSNNSKNNVEVPENNNLTKITNVVQNADTNFSSQFYTFNNKGNEGILNLNSKDEKNENNPGTNFNSKINFNDNKNIKESNVIISDHKVQEDPKNSSDKVFKSLNTIDLVNKNTKIHTPNKEFAFTDFKVDETEIYKKLNNLNTFSNKKQNNNNLSNRYPEDQISNINLKKSFVSNTISDNSPIYANMMNNKNNTFIIETNSVITKNFDNSKDLNSTTQKIDDITSNLNNTITMNNNLSNATYNFTSNINNITLNNKENSINNMDFKVNNIEEIKIDINSLDNKSFTPPSIYNSSSIKDNNNKKENEILNVTDDNIGLDEEEPSVKSENHSVISSKIMSHINTPKMLTDLKTSELSFYLSNYTKSDASHRWDNNHIFGSINQSKYISEDFEYEIMPENLDSYNNLIDTPKSSNIYLPILKTNGYINKIDGIPKNLTASYNFNHPQLKELNERLSKKEKEMKKINEKIQQVMSDLLIYEEENKKYERKIEKEEAEGQMLRHFLNFLTTKA
jgi:hypothetical protein